VRIGLTEYVAFLRGINVGGNKKIKMDALRSAFESLGFQRVRTVLASGNVLFDAAEPDPLAITRQIQEKLSSAFGLDVGIMVRTRRQIGDLVDADPFSAVKVTPDTRLYVTFFADRLRGKLKTRHEPHQEALKMLGVSSGEVCSAIELSPGAGTPELMKFIDKEFGRENTTRNWNTVLKIHDKMAGPIG
jgi:uncharacterized protein (DUF1697 family)